MWTADEWRAEFAGFEGVAYLNAAAQAPMPRVAAEAAHAAVGGKQLPFRVPEEAYFGLPNRVRALLARLLGGQPEEFAITSGASSGLGIVAAQLDWHEGDEVLIAQGEFPAHFAAFKPLEVTRGVRVRVVAPRGGCITAADFLTAMTPQTRLITAAVVRSDDGSRLHTAELGARCRHAGVQLVLDLAQCAGAIPLRLEALGADFVVASGYKWLLSPYGTGFFWARPEAMEALLPGPFYWMAIDGAHDFGDLTRLQNAVPVAGARRWDAPETANFINLAAMEAALDWIVRKGVAAIAAYNAGLIQQLLAHLPEDAFMLASPAAEADRGPYVCLRPREKTQLQPLLARLAEEKIIASVRGGSLRVSPYVYNSEDDIARLLAVLAQAPR